MLWLKLRHSLQGLIAGSKEGISVKSASFLDDASNSTLGVRERQLFHPSWHVFKILITVDHHPINQFAKIFVISLPSRGDRRDAMTLAAAVSGLDIEFIDGIVGSDVDPKTLSLVGEAKGLRPPELGIWRAHLNVYREIVQRNITSALIMEVSTPTV